MSQIDPQKNIGFYYNFTSKFFESDSKSDKGLICIIILSFGYICDLESGRRCSQATPLQAYVR